MFISADKRYMNNMIFGRIMVIIAIQLFLVFYSFVYCATMDQDQFNILTIINISALLSCVFAFKAVEKEFKSLLMNLGLALFDSTYVVTLVFLTGYNNSPFILLLPIYIFFTTITFKTRGALLSTFISVAVVLTGYIFTKKPLTNFNYAVTISAVIVLFALITRYFIGKTTKVSSDIKELNRLSRLLVENLELGIININKRGFISSINKTAEKIFQSKDNISSMLDELLEAGSKEPHKIDLKGDVNLFIYRVETPHGVTLIAKDISNDEKIDKLKLINTITSVLAHEIKNPVSSIAGVSELIRMDKDILSDQGQKDKLLSIIDRESSRLTNLVEEFLIYSGSEKRKNEEINLNAIVQNTCDNIRVNKEFVDKNLKMEISLLDEEPSPVIFGDFYRLSQAFDNVMMNAVQASQTDGSIRCSVTSTGDNITISISDNGAGIPEDIKNRIYEPFFTTKEKGTGLGLAIVKNIILAHGGEIGVKQNKKGTTFEMTFHKSTNTGAN
ncbi:MAG: ATP-binding protein [bacterium]